MQDPRTGQSRATGSTLSLGNLLTSLKVDVQCRMHNSGNDAFMCLFALQKLLDPEHTQLPEMKVRGRGMMNPINRGALGTMMPRPVSISPSMMMYPMMGAPAFSSHAAAALLDPKPTLGTTGRSYSGPIASQERLSGSDEFGQMANSLQRPSLKDRRLSSMPQQGESRPLSMFGLNVAMQSMTTR